MAFRLPDTLSDTTVPLFPFLPRIIDCLLSTWESTEKPDGAGALVSPAPSPPAMFKLNAQGVQEQVSTLNNLYSIMYKSFGAGDVLLDSSLILSPPIMPQDPASCAGL